MSFINDRIDIALSVNASGVHLGQEDLPLSYTRKIIGNHKLIGITVNTLREAIDAQKGGADYLGVGPVYFTATKNNPPPSKKENPNRSHLFIVRGKITLSAVPETINPAQ